MSTRSKNYADMMFACSHQTTSWLRACHSEPGAFQNGASRLAVRNSLRQRLGAQFEDVCHETAYGATQRLSFSARCF